MTVTPEQLEWIVQEVIRRLRAADDEQPPPAAASELRLSDRVVTLAALKDRLNNVSRVSVPSKAVVTPAVRDELRQRGVELVRQTS
jgi:hypothetical protein